jgi:hypothetical protein
MPELFAATAAEAFTAATIGGAELLGRRDFGRLDAPRATITLTAVRTSEPTFARASLSRGDPCAEGGPPSLS